MSRATNGIQWKRSSTVLMIAALLFAVAITVFVFTGGSHSIDQWAFDTIAPHRTAGRTHLMVVFSFLGNHLFLIPANFLLLFYLLYTKQKEKAIYLAVVALSSLSMMSVLKRSFHRSRPDHPLVDGIVNFSFPSGHSFMSVAFYGLIIWWVMDDIKNKTQRNWPIASLLLLIICIGFSRVYLQVHYVTDVLAGWAFGTCWLLCSIWLAAMIIARNKPNKRIDAIG